MLKNISKTTAKKRIGEFFENTKNKTPKEIKKIKRFAMRYNLSLKEKRKMFCKHCYTIFDSKNSEVRINFVLGIIFIQMVYFRLMTLNLHK